MSLRNLAVLVWVIYAGLLPVWADVTPGPFQLPQEWQERNPWRPLPRREIPAPVPPEPVYRRAPEPVAREEGPTGSEHLYSTREVQSDDGRIVGQAASILRGKKFRRDLDRAGALHDWVARNVRYDVASLDSGDYRTMRTDALTALSTRLTVCQGYATLLAALLRASGIPARLIRGYAVSDTYSQAQTETAFAEAENERTMHAWVEAYVGGRWVIMDPTWNSGYTQGKKGERNRRFIPSFGREFFDPKQDVWHRTHRRMEVQDPSQY